MTRKTLTISSGKRRPASILDIPLITIQPRQLNTRLWELMGKEADRTITAEETAELNALCSKLEKEAE